MEEISKIGVIGSGSWATAIAKILLANVPSINWYFRTEDQISQFKTKHHNPSYLTGVLFDTDRIHFSSDINQIVSNSDTLVFAVPSAFLKSAIAPLTVPLADKFVVSAIKGLVPDENLIIGSYFHKIHGVPIDRIGVITGPCHAEVVALERLSY